MRSASHPNSTVALVPSRDRVTNARPGGGDGIGAGGATTSAPAARWTPRSSATSASGHEGSRSRATRRNGERLVASAATPSSAPASEPASIASGRGGV
jgi:hypothetical protein